MTERRTWMNGNVGPGLDSGAGVLENATYLLTKERNSHNDYDGDQRNHEAVLDGSGATVAPKRGDPDLKLDKLREHLGPFIG